jgi:hypothetical protein
MVCRNVVTPERGRMRAAAGPAMDLAQNHRRWSIAAGAAGCTALFFNYLDLASGLHLDLPSATW